MTEIKIAGIEIYLTQHMNAKGITDAAMAKILGVCRHTVLRSRQHPEKLPVRRLQQFADALNLQDWRELTYPPKRPPEAPVEAPGYFLLKTF